MANPESKESTVPLVQTTKAKIQPVTKPKAKKGRALFANIVVPILVFGALALGISIITAGIFFAATGVFSPVNFIIGALATNFGLQIVATANVVLAANVALYVTAGLTASLTTIMSVGIGLSTCFFLFDKLFGKSEEPEATKKVFVKDGNLSGDEQKPKAKRPAKRPALVIPDDNKENTATATTSTLPNSAGFKTKTLNRDNPDDAKLVAVFDQFALLSGNKSAKKSDKKTPAATTSRSAAASTFR